MIYLPAEFYLNSSITFVLLLYNNSMYMKVCFLIPFRKDSNNCLVIDGDWVTEEFEQENWAQ